MPITELNINNLFCLKKKKNHLSNEKTASKMRLISLDPKFVLNVREHKAKLRHKAPIRTC